MGLADVRTGLYVKDRHLVTVAGALVSAASLMDIVKLVVKPNSVPAPVVTFRQMAPVVVLMGIHVLTVRLEIAARVAAFVATPLAIVRLDARVNLAPA